MYIKKIIVGLAHLPALFGPLLKAVLLFSDWNIARVVFGGTGLIGPMQSN